MSSPAVANGELYRDRAVILRTYKLRESDRIIVLLTQRSGKVRAVAKHVHAFVELEKMRPTPFPPTLLKSLRGMGLVD